jgi:hypothetical protein
MSLFDGNASAALGLGGNNNNYRDNRNGGYNNSRYNNSNRNNNNNSRGGYQQPQQQDQSRNHNSGKKNRNQNQRNFSFNANEVLDRLPRVFDEDNQNQSNTPSSSVIKDAASTLKEFIAGYNNTISDGQESKDLITDMYSDIVAVIRNFYDPKYESIMGEMNAVLDIMSTQHFAAQLRDILKAGLLADIWEAQDVWKNAAFAISTLLDTSAAKMKDDTIETYVEILSSKGMWEQEINKLTNSCGITTELATDLVIVLPVLPEDMNDLALRTLYHRFVDKIIEHSEDNIDILDRDTQAKLFTFFFGKSSIALKALGKFLSDPVEKVDGAALLIYEEFKSMLFSNLDMYDIKDIIFVLNFIVGQKKSNPNVATVFSANAAKYDNIRKAITTLISKDSGVKEYLV